jgi:hypothetical protein
MKSLAALAFLILSINSSPMPSLYRTTTASVKISNTTTGKLKARCNLVNSTTVKVVAYTGLYNCQCLHDRLTTYKTTFGDCTGLSYTVDSSIVAPRASCDYNSGAINYRSSQIPNDCQCLLDLSAAKVLMMKDIDPPKVCSLVEESLLVSISGSHASQRCEVVNALCNLYPTRISNITTYAGKVMNSTCANACALGADIPDGC